MKCINCGYEKPKELNTSDIFLLSKLKGNSYNIKEISEIMKISYKNTWFRVKKLHEMNLIKKEEKINKFGKTQILTLK